MSKLSKVVKKVTKVVKPAAKLLVNPINPVAQQNFLSAAMGKKKNPQDGINAANAAKDAQNNSDFQGLLDKTQASSQEDYAKLLAEAEHQKQTQTEGAATRQSTRDQMLRDYGNLLQSHQQQLINQDMPGLYEDLNTRGLLRSSELGNAVSKRQAEANNNLQYALSTQALSDRGANLNDLSGIENQYNQGRMGALQRQFSVQDFGRGAEASKLIGVATMPNAQPTPSAKGGGALTGALGGAGIGATFGGIPGAIIGGGAGLVGGGQLASK